jgi:hypothetical protein
MSGLSTVRLGKRPFKGKGADEWLAQLTRDYAKVVAEMKRLSDLSRSVAGHPWYVYLHHREATGQYFLMWRSFGLKHVHLTWTSILPLLRRMGSEQVEWFEDMNEAMRFLNAQEKATRKAMRIARELVETREGL